MADFSVLADVNEVKDASAIADVNVVPDIMEEADVSVLEGISEMVYVNVVKGVCVVTDVIVMGNVIVVADVSVVPNISVVANAVAIQEKFTTKSGGKTIILKVLIFGTNLTITKCTNGHLKADWITHNLLNLSPTIWIGKYKI